MAHRASLRGPHAGRAGSVQCGDCRRGRNRVPARSSLHHGFPRHAAQERPVIFAVPGCGKDASKAFSTFRSGITEHLPKAEVTVDWFHIVQTFTKRLDEVRKKERRGQEHPKSLRWALFKNLENENLTPKQLAALQELVADQSATADSWVIKEKLRWIKKAPTPRAARWRITHYLKVMQAAVSEKPLLKPMGKPPLSA